MRLLNSNSAHTVNNHSLLAQDASPSPTGVSLPRRWGWLGTAAASLLEGAALIWAESEKPMSSGIVCRISKYAQK